MTTGYESSVYGIVFEEDERELLRRSYTSEYKLSHSIFAHEYGYTREEIEAYRVGADSRQLEDGEAWVFLYVEFFLRAGGSVREELSGTEFPAEFAEGAVGSLCERLRGDGLGDCLSYFFVEVRGD